MKKKMKKWKNEKMKKWKNEKMKKMKKWKNEKMKKWKMFAVLNLITQQKGRVYLSVMPAQVSVCWVRAVPGITQALHRHYKGITQCRAVPGPPAPAPRPAPTAHHRSWVTIQCFCLYTLSSNNQLNIIRGTVQCTVQCTVSSYKCRLRGTSNSVAWVFSGNSVRG